MFLYRNICPRRRNALNALVPQNADHVIGVLSGWDRLVFRGTLRMLAFAGGMAAYLSPGRLHRKSFSEQDLFQVGVVPTGGETLVLDADLQRVVVLQQAQRGATEDAEVGVGMAKTHS